VAVHLRTVPKRLWLGVSATVAALSLLASIAATPATAAPKIGGDPDALSYFQQVVSDYQHIPGARVVEYGLFFLHYNGGTSVDFRWGANKPPGFKAAKAVIDYWLKNGKIVGYLATITARDVPRLRVLVAAGNVFLSTTQCWERSTPASAPFGVGERFLVSDSNGRFQALEQNGRNTIVKYHYIWSEGTRATETATLLPGNPPPIRSKIVTTGAVKLKIAYSIRPLKRAPDLPLKARGPKPPLPAPFCKKAES